MEKEKDAGRINQEAGLEICGGSREVYREILALLLTYENEKGQLLKASYQNQDWKLFGNEVHALKSSAAGIGAETFSAAARSMEEAVDAGDFDFVAKHQESFFQLLGDTLLEIHTILEA